MRLNNIEEVNDLITAINQAKGPVWVEINRPELNSLKYKPAPILSVDMKSSLSMFVALGKIIEITREDTNEYEVDLYCGLTEDESLFYKFFQEHKDALN